MKFYRRYLSECLQQISNNSHIAELVIFTINCIVWLRQSGVISCDTVYTSETLLSSFIQAGEKSVSSGFHPISLDFNNKIVKNCLKYRLRS